MSRRIIIAGILWFSIFTAIVLAGCSREATQAQSAAASRESGGDALHGGFRIRRDPARNRIWLLGLDSVRIYDGQSKRLIREIALPSWSVARLGCDPDLVLDGSGSAIVSSNVQPRLWRIDGRSFEVSEHPIVLEGRDRWDVGFGTLAINADGTLFALTSVSESIWSIDLVAGRARVLVPGNALLNVCGLKPRLSRKTGSGLDAVTNFVPATGGEYAVSMAEADIIPAISGRGIANAKGGKP
jgi:hypothetical protein